MASIEEKVETLLKPKIEKIGYELYDVLYLKEGKNYTLRVVIDSENGIDLNDCEKVNNEINDLLDEADYIKDQYFLEVSSPGIERILRKDWQIKRYINEEIEVKLFKKDDNGFKEYQGILRDVTDNELIVEVTAEEKEKNNITEKADAIKTEETEKTEDKTKTYKIERKNISQIKTIYKDF